MEKLLKENKKSIFKTPYMFIVPALMFYIFFWFLPVSLSLFESFTSIDGGFSLENFRMMFDDPLFFEAFRNTLIFAVVSLFLQFILALFLALLINRNFKGSKMFLFIMLIPMAIPPSAVGILWNTGLVESGWINSVFATTGIQNLIELAGISDGPIIWKEATGLQAVFMIILIDTWTVLPSVMIILLAGLQNFNEEYSEAALVFGATKLQALRHVIIPIIKPTIVTALLLRIISGLQVWLISVMIFGFNNVPFLLERIVFYTDQVRLGTYSYKLSVTYSVFVVLVVSVTAYIFIKLTKGKDWSGTSE
ncbi:MAG: sugar ABC transporter permease [Tenericutes bacterium]|nr:sugar ABC transporter permease [Mycoplasmatota bacterium]